MNRPIYIIPVACLLTVLGLFSMACFWGGQCPDEEEATRVEMGEGAFIMHWSSGDVEEGDMPHSSHPLYVRVISEDTVEVLYERDDEVIVETYQVTDRDTEVGYY